MEKLTSYKFKSRLITLLGAIFVYLSTLSIEQIRQVLPVEYQYLAPLIVIIIGFGVAQLSEEKRVYTAEERVIQKYEQESTEVEFDGEGC